MIGGLGMPELIVILVIVLIIFGAGKLPEIGAGLGKGIKNFKKATQEASDLTSDKAEQLEEKAPDKDKSA
ncbi:MAG: twin-arginine translocase TatA/TatE family subunit [Syntrophobacteraceae bacterium]